MQASKTHNHKPTTKAEHIDTCKDRRATTDKFQRDNKHIAREKNNEPTGDKTNAKYNNTTPFM